MKVRCDFCWRYCTLDEGQKGVCAVRQVIDGTLISLNYGQVVAVGIDPVEKKPLYHFYPHHKTLSFALFGCNYSCSYCQNYSISQKEYYPQREGVLMQPAQLVDEAIKHRCPSISFTYSEPLVWQDYLLEVAHLAKDAGLMTIMISNGSFSTEALDRILPAIDAFNIDLKGDEHFYRSLCSARIEPVLDALEAITGFGAHLEVTTMVMEGYHTKAVIEYLSSLLVERGVSVWHLSRYFPHYHRREQPTSERYLASAITQARKSGIAHIYAGNSTLESSTICPSCGAELVHRDRYTTGPTDAIDRDGRCIHCGTTIYGRFPSR
jgi:pyruvate formate lyase activating enzyme